MSRLPAAASAEGKLRYDNLDGVRAYAAVGIVLMHVLSNGKYGLDGFVFDRLIPSFTDLVFLFMIVSGFAMCCGYYEKTVSGQLDLNKFYAKRFAKVWPFFTVLCVADFAMSPGLTTLYELMADLTLCFGLLPDAHISVIGVGWFLGLVFVFYFMFPFFCSLLSNKKRAWFALAVALLLSLLTTVRFGGERYHLGYSGVFFLTGGMIYLYREPLHRFVERFGWVMVLLTAGALGLYCWLGSCVPTQLLVCCVLAIGAIGKKNVIMNNPLTRMLSGVSMEIYLCHMMVFRVLEKLKLVRLFQSELLSYVVTAAMTLVGAISMALIINKLLSVVSSLLRKWKSGGKSNVR